MGALEAKLIITAEDRTKAAFDAIMARMDGVFKASAGIERAQASAARAMSGVEAAVERSGHAMAVAARNMERAAHSMERSAVAMSRASQAAGAAGARGPIVLPPGGGRPHGRGGGHGVHGLTPYTAANLTTKHGAKHAIAAGGYAGGGFAGAVGAIVAYEAATHAAKENAERQHERVREDIAGMSPAERAEAEKHAALLASRYRMRQTDVMHTLRNARGITGSYSEAADLADELLKTRIVAQAAKPGRDVEGDFDKLLKGLEEYGVTQHPKEAREALRRVQKVLAVEGDTLTANDIYQSFKYTRQALPGTSQRFMLGTAPALAQEMGGSNFGTALSSFNQALVQGRMSHRSLKLAMDLGLIAKEDVNLDKKGEPKNVKTILEGGHGFKDWRLAKSDPDQWIWQRLSKALADHKITDPDAITQTASTLFGDRKAGEFVGKILTQKDRIEKNQANLQRAPDDPAARIMAGDPIAAARGMGNSLDNMAAAIPASGSKVTGALGEVADRINDVMSRWQGVKTDHAQKAENKAAYGIEAPQDLTRLKPPELADLKAAGLAELQRKIVAEQLEMNGLADEVARRNAERAKGGFWERLGFGGAENETGSLIGRIAQLRAEIEEIKAAKERLSHFGETPPAKPGTMPAATGPERDRIERAATGGAALAGPFGAPGAERDRIERAATGGGHIDVAGTLTGDIQGNLGVDVKVTASPELTATVSAAKSILAKGAATARVGAGGGNAPTGNSMPEANPTGKSGGGR